MIHESENQRMPVLFIGHGNPMYGIQENQYTRGWRGAIEGIPKPAAIAVVSAHWETAGTRVTAMPRPRVIHDFYGFPQELFEARYDAPGDPAMARAIVDEFREHLIALDESWGLDHGSWTILRHLYPEADIPVLQISLDVGKSPAEHFRLAAELRHLRDRGVLVIGSGNIVHNLRAADFRNTVTHEWALSANEKLKNLISAGENDKLTEYGSLGSDVRLAVPTPEHYLPLLYTLALRDEGESVGIFNEGIDLASISMTSVRIG